MEACTSKPVRCRACFQFLKTFVSTAAWPNLFPYLLITRNDATNFWLKNKVFESLPFQYTQMKSDVTFESSCVRAQPSAKTEVHRIGKRLQRCGTLWQMRMMSWHTRYCNSTPCLLGSPPELIIISLLNNSKHTIMGGRRVRTSKNPYQPPFLLENRSSTRYEILNVPTKLLPFPNESPSETRSVKALILRLTSCHWAMSHSSNR